MIAGRYSSKASIACIKNHESNIAIEQSLGLIIIDLLMMSFRTIPPVIIELQISSQWDKKLIPNFIKREKTIKYVCDLHQNSTNYLSVTKLFNTSHDMSSADK